jgi:glycine oxidase
MARADVTVRGGGIFGLSIAWACARRGARVRLIETLAIGAGSSGGIVGAMSPHVPEAWNSKKQFQLESLLMAEGWWADVAAASGLRPGYKRSGRLQPLADAGAIAAAKARGESAAKLWGEAAVWRVIPATGAAWEPASPSGWLIEDTLSARVHPRMALAALTEALRAGGGEVVLGPDAAEEGAVVHATGLAGLEALSRDLGREVGRGVKGQALSLRYDAGAAAPQLFVDGLHIVPHGDGTVAIGSTSEAKWDDPAPDAGLERLLEQAVASLPVLAGAEVAERWAGIRPRAQSRAPVLGAWPGRAGHFLANGGFKIGFGIAPKVAEVMADLVLESKDHIPEAFRVEALG